MLSSYINSSKSLYCRLNLFSKCIWLVHQKDSRPRNDFAEVYKIWNHIIVLRWLPKCLFKCPHKAFLWLSYFFCLGFKLKNSYCPPLGALMSLSCCSFGSQNFLLANRQNNRSARFPPLFIPSRERALCSENVLKATAVEVAVFSELYFLYLFSTSKVSLSFSYLYFSYFVFLATLYFSCWALFNSRPGWYSCLFSKWISLCLTYLVSF